MINQIVQAGNDDGEALHSRTTRQQLFQFLLSPLASPSFLLLKKVTVARSFQTKFHLATFLLQPADDDNQVIGNQQKTSYKILSCKSIWFQARGEPLSFVHPKKINKF